MVVACTPTPEEQIELKQLEKPDLVHIKLIGHIEVDYKEDGRTVESDLFCNLETGNCGNDLYYEQGKGFYWLGLQNISGLMVEAKIVR